MSADRIIVAFHVPFLYAYEALKRAELALDVPVAVVKHNQIIDLSPAALQAGAAFHLPLRAMRHAIPELKTFTFHAESYSDVADKICTAISAYTPIVEPLEPHLVLADLTGCQYSNITDIITSINSACALPAFAGIASTRAVALLAAAYITQKARAELRGAERASWPAAQHPNTLQAHHGHAVDFLAPLSVQQLIELRLPGLTEIIEQLINLGVFTLGELAALPIACLIQQFGVKTGPLLHNLAIGKDPTPVKALYPPDQAVAVFHVPTESMGLGDAISIDHVLVCLSKDLSAELAARSKAARVITLEIKVPGKSIEKSKNLRRPARHTDTILAAARRLWTEADIHQPVCSLALHGRDLTAPDIGLGNAFVNNDTVSDGMKKALQSVHCRFGSHALQKGEHITFSRRELVRQLWEAENL